GTLAAHRLAADADVVIGIGTRWTDFTTGSKTAFANPAVRFVNANVAEFDAAKHAGVAVVADARAALEALAEIDYRVEGGYREEATKLGRAWDAEVTGLYSIGDEPLPAESEVLGAVDEGTAPTDVVV